MADPCAGAANPLVSILTPSFNQGHYIGQCLASVRAQSYGRIEHVVADGGSSDETVSLLMTAPDARWVSEPDRGQADAVNKAFRMSTGSIIGWINSDDALFCRQAVACVVEAFQRDPNTDVIVGDAALVGPHNELLRHIRSWWPSRAPYPVRNTLVQPAAFVRRSALDEGRSEPLRLDLNYLLDYELWVRLAEEGKRFRHIRLVLAIDRDHPGRKTLADPRLRTAELELLYREYGRERFVRRRETGVWSGINRLAGLRDVMAWDRRYELALDFDVPSFLTRMRNQMGRRHRSLFSSVGG